ncbi:39S ribosomal protein L47, mitochondrial, partial [Coelomomyces lativittatus]
MSLIQRSFHRLRPILQKSSAQNVRGLEEFFESRTSIPTNEIVTGRAWESADLRIKSFDDIHKLWYVILKERNMLETQKEESRRLCVPFLHAKRLQKCKSSMARIKQVLTERQAAWEE